MVISPSSAVRLCAVPLDKTQKNQIHFTSAANQAAYFASKIVISYNEFTYVRKDSYIRVNKVPDDCYTANYLMYKNENFGDKWFYAFIERIEWVNENCSFIHFKTDVYQTWLFEAEIKPSFVAREHVTTDTVGLHTVPEDLDTGELMTEIIAQTDVCDHDNALIIAACIPDGTILSGSGKMYNGVYSPCIYVYANQDEVTTLDSMLDNLAAAGKEDMVTAIFMFPKSFLPLNGDGTINTTVDMPTQTITVDKPTQYENYIPKNNKLLTYPYSFLYLTNRCGSAAVLRFEFFDSADVQIELKANIGPNPTVYAYPKHYKGMTWHIEEGITISGFPFCAWRYDVFKNWLAQNTATIGTQALSTGFALAASAATGNVIGAGSGIVAAAGIIGSIAEHSIQPPQVRGSAVGSAPFSADLLSPLLAHRTIRGEYAKRIDDFFEMYGYKIGEVKQPNVTGRPYWNYLQTVDINIVGEIPNDDMAELKSIYNNGVTLWHNTSYVCDYSRNNH